MPYPAAGPARCKTARVLWASGGSSLSTPLKAGAPGCLPQHRPLHELVWGREAPAASRATLFTSPGEPPWKGTMAVGRGLFHLLSIQFR